eukprot:CAMPEP_0173213546 /NCGR_PEP_ID=MMETSP1141-20130122/25471_1 /TAXON_ID=483371 /ORGANISM="non described non described, Strain CCMP2298" /LENGTH=81 /DNA_ID=CAMNT_0014140799 /DNA_START=157 /DNA_END=402 /DNA_ORIENTATION=-
MQHLAQVFVARVGVLGAGPGLLADGEVRGGDLLGGLQSAVLAGGLSVLAYLSVRLIGIVHHAVVHTAIQFQSGARLEDIIV